MLTKMGLKSLKNPGHFSYQLEGKWMVLVPQATFKDKIFLKKHQNFVNWWSKISGFRHKHSNWHVFQCFFFQYVRKNAKEKGVRWRQEKTRVHVDTFGPNSMTSGYFIVQSMVQFGFLIWKSHWKVSICTQWGKNSDFGQ